MRFASRFFLYAPLAGLLLLAAIAMVHWWLVASALASHLDSINGREVMPGVRLSFAQKRLAGFPFRMDTILKNLRVEVTEIGGPVVWTSEDFAMHTLTYGRVQAILEGAGRQTLSWHDANGGPHTFTFLPGTFRASAILQQGKLIRFDSEIVDLDGAEFRAGNAQLHFRAARGGTELYVRFLNTHLTGGYAASLGLDIASLVANGRMDHATAIDALLRGEEAPKAALEKWRDAGGRIAMRELTLARKGYASVTFTGKLTLDDLHDLNGTLHTRNGSTLDFSGNRLVLQSRPARP